MKSPTLKRNSFDGSIPKDWEITNLGKLGKAIIGLTYQPNDVVEEGKGTLVLRSSNVRRNGIVFDDNVFVKGDIPERAIVKVGDILVCVRNGSRSLIGKSARITEKCKGMAFGAFMSVFRSDSNDYLVHVFQSGIFQKEINRNIGATINQITSKDLMSFRLPLPPPSEQIAIAKILSTWEDAILKTELLVEKKELELRWLMQQLLSGKKRTKKHTANKKRRKSALGKLPADWKLASLTNLLIPVKKSFQPLENKKYQQIGIRSHLKGIFYKERVSGAELGEKRVFWIVPDCFIVNIVFAWEHAIAKTTSKEVGMIASHRFPMFKPVKGILNLDFLLYYFKSSRGKHLLGLASPGGAGRNKTLGQSDFLNLQIPVPGIEEQTAIVNILNAGENQIQILKNKLMQLRNQKKGLMQQLLTGKKTLTNKNYYEKNVRRK